jgi:GntR family transcriptional regulator
MLINRSAFKPIYLQISDLIRNDIESGKLKVGDRIWSERYIVEEFKVSRNTAKEAIEELARNGLVTRLQGHGTFVSDNRVSFGLQRMTSFSEEMEMRGLHPSSRLLSHTRVLADSNLSQKLGIQFEEPVYRLERLRLADDRPMAHHVSFVPVSRCPNLDRFDFSNLSLFSVLEQEYGLKLTWQEMVLTPVIAHKDEAAILNIKMGVPLLRSDGVAFLEDDTPIEAHQILFRSDLYQFTARSVRKSMFV